MQETFWNEHYKKFVHSEPSRFAKWCLSDLFRDKDTVVELGCGNGRDGLAIAQKVAGYVGIDSCPVALSSFEESAALVKDNLRSIIKLQQMDFTNVDFNIMGAGVDRLVLYSRFSLHSVNYNSAESLFQNVSRLKNKNWVMILEARTIYDTLYGQGEEVGRHEFKTDHYRRFIDPNEFFAEITTRFVVPYFEISRGFAPFLGDDPVVMRAEIRPLGYLW